MNQPVSKEVRDALIAALEIAHEEVSKTYREAYVISSEKGVKMDPETVARHRGAMRVANALSKHVDNLTEPPLHEVELKVTAYIRAWTPERAGRIAEYISVDDSVAIRACKDDEGEDVEDIDSIEVTTK